MKTTTWVVAVCLSLGACSSCSDRVGETFRDCADCPEMVVIPPGRFQMGSPDNERDRYSDLIYLAPERDRAYWASQDAASRKDKAFVEEMFKPEGPVHEVHIRYAFSVAKYPITRHEWKQFVKETRHHDNSDCLMGEQDNHPVVCVSWEDAQDYAAWLSRKSGQHYRLLSEAEYEYVNRAGTQTAYFWGDSADDLPRYANVNENGPTPVGSLKPNAFGVYDTTGNVQSWTQDCYHKNYDGAPTDGSAWESNCSDGRIIRGSYWSQPPWMHRVAFRAVDAGPVLTVGVRLASTAR
jgi:formylglycine-generating enzyme required for sulfatase activity